MQKNVASQKFVVFAFNKTNNNPLTGDAANITANLQKDFGTAAATNDVNPTELEDGFYAFDALQAETNADALVIYPASTTPDIQVIGVPSVIYTTPSGFSDDVMRGTNSAALASEYTAGRAVYLDELAAANLPTDIAANQTDLNTLITNVAENQTDLNTIITNVGTVDTVVDGIQTDLSNATDGLGALKTLIDTVNTDLANGTDGLGALKALIDTVDTVADGIQTDLSNGTDGLGALKALIDTVDTVADAIKAETVLILADTTELITFTVGSASLTTTTFSTNLTLVADQYGGSGGNSMYIRFDLDTTTAALRGQTAKITGCAVTNGVITISSALTTAPVNTDSGQIF